MKNLYFGKNDFFIKSISSNGKKSNDNEINYNYIRKKLSLDRLNIINDSVSQKIVTNLVLTNQRINNNERIIYNLKSNESESNSVINNYSKLKPINKKKIFENKELEKITYDFFDNKNRLDNKNILKRTLNKSAQSNLSLEEEKEKKKIKTKQEQFSKIDILLNKKMFVKKNIPKLKKITFKFNKEKNSFIKDLPKSNYINIFNRPYNQRIRPLRNYIKYLKDAEDKDISGNSLIKSINTNTRNNSLIIPENRSYRGKNIYEVINNTENKKVFYSSRLIIDDNLSKNNKENNFYIKKGNEYNSLVSSYSNLFLNKYNLVHKKIKYNSMNIKNKNAKKVGYITLENMKNLSKKGYEEMNKRKLKDLNKKINNAVKVIEDNKKRFIKFFEVNAQIYLKNKKITLDNDDDLF